MLVKFEADDELIDLLKRHTGCRVASKAVEATCQRYEGMYLQIKRLQAHNEELRECIYVQSQIINSARSAASALLDRVGQEDMFLPKPVF